MHGDDLLGHLDQLLLATHGLAPHQGVGVFLVAALHLHQQALGQLDALALGQLGVAGLQLGTQGLVALEAGHGHVEDRLQALGLDALDDVGADPGLDGLAHHLRVVLVGEHDDRPWLVTGDQHHLFHYIAAGRFGVDQHHVGAHRLDPLGQVDGQAGFVDHLEAGFDQRALQATDLFRRIVDQEYA